MNQSKLITAEFTKRPTLVLQPRSGQWTDDNFHFLLRGEWGRFYQVEKNDNGQGWSPLALITNQFGTTQINDANATNRGMRLYRAVGP